MDARTLARVTGSVAATVTVERRDPETGDLVVESTDAYERPYVEVVVPRYRGGCLVRVGRQTYHATPKGDTFDVVHDGSDAAAPGCPASRDVTRTVVLHLKYSQHK